MLATNADLLDAVRRGKFREDLYYRLMIHYISVPPLRDRPDDIPLLTRRFLRDGASFQGREEPESYRRFLDALEGYRFPGNVRELHALVNAALGETTGSSLSVDYVRRYLKARKDPDRAPGAHSPAARPAAEIPDRSLGGDRFPSLREVTEAHIREALRRAGNNQSLAASLLGVSQSTISRFLKEGRSMHSA